MTPLEKAKAKQAMQEEDKEEKKGKQVKKRKSKPDHPDSLKRANIRTRGRLLKEEPKALTPTPPPSIQ